MFAILRGVIEPDLEGHSFGTQDLYELGAGLAAIFSGVFLLQNALKTGQIDAMSMVDLRTAHLFEKAKDIQIVRVTGRKHYTFPMNMGIPPNDNKNVRLALKLAVDRKHKVRVRPLLKKMKS